MKTRILYLCIVLIACAGAISCGVYQKTSVVQPMEIQGAKYVKMRMCAPCHRESVEAFEKSTHARISTSSMEKEGIGCGMCHGPASLHIENQYDPNLIINPRKNPEVCFRCHLDKKAEFRLQYHHPVIEGKVACADCHNSHGTESRSWTVTSYSETNEVCFKCHLEQRGPFVFEHEAMREGCTICHKVHGSINDKLLIARDSNVCLQCHFQTQIDSSRFMIGNFDHDSRLSRGTCFSGECHTAVHGSNFDDHLRY